MAKLKIPKKVRRITPRNLRLLNCSVDVALRRSGRQVHDVIDLRGDIKVASTS
ncbi:hypothetical protein [Rhizobium leguminosarum]|uniref:hypothetical protein n=1 Tax=Rhizobium leguminosarum TaxID=384 RepID=UPI0013E3985A|nr:hypothetical protein [Rhizobium leguminosarum]